MRILALLLTAIAVAAALAPGARAEWLGDFQYCINWSGMLPETTQRPYGAVGYLTNGCTATLVGRQHILTAAHCMVAEGASSNYWTNLAAMYFYPNYHRGAVDPPRYRVEHAVVGAHANTGNQYFPSDWAIARLEKPVSGFPWLPIDPDFTGSAPPPVVVPNYSRDPVQFLFHACAEPPDDDQLGCSPGWKGPNFPNSWWQDGFLSEGVLSLDPAIAYNRAENAPGLGGCSGSPHLFTKDGVWKIAGVTHGGLYQDACAGVGGPWAGRFVHAPWFASNAAVATAPSSPDRTGVFVIDSDRNRLVFRERLPADSGGHFGFFDLVKALPRGTFRRLAAFKLGGTSLPGVAILSDAGVVREIDREGDGWSAWKTITPPPEGTVQDIDAAYREDGAGRLYAVTASGLYVRTRKSAEAGAAWQWSWGKIAGAASHPYTRVTAIRHDGDGLNQAWALTTRGTIRTVRETTLPNIVFPVWGAAEAFAGPPPEPGHRVIDLDAGWNAQGRAMLVALRSSGNAWYREAESTLSGATWSAWKPLPDRVDPGTGIIDSTLYDVWVNRGGVSLTSITASRFVETDSGTIVPVVVATDTWGNVYQTTFSDATGGWSSWMPFYGKRLRSSQAVDVLD